MNSEQWKRKHATSAADTTAANGIDDFIAAISDREFESIRRFIFEQAGISLSPQKQQLVATRLRKRLLHYGFRKYGDYYHFVCSKKGIGERQIMVDKLTTNETYFFREPAHFDYLKTSILPTYQGKSFRTWSAACSTGEEVYTLAIIMAEILGLGDWEVHGSDINHSVIEAARTGIYPIERARDIPRPLLKKYCLKGVRTQQDQILVDQRLKQHVRFRAMNLKLPLRDVPRYQVIFLRNVLIYFNAKTKQEIVTRVLERLEPGGHLFVSHVESLHGIVDRQMDMVRPSVFRKAVSSPAR